MRTILCIVFSILGVWTVLSVLVGFGVARFFRHGNKRYADMRRSVAVTKIYEFPVSMGAEKVDCPSRLAKI